MREREPGRVFVSYAPEDRAFFEAFEKHLGGLRRAGRIVVWHVGQLVAGTTFAVETRAQLDGADVVVLLVSPDFMASDRCWQDQLRRALDRHARGEVVLVPVRIRAVHTGGTPFEQLQMLPRDGKPIGDPDNDTAMAQVAEELARHLEADEEDEDGRLHAGGGRAAHRREPGDRPEDFHLRLEKLLRLREPGKLTRCRAPAPLVGVWEIEVSTDPMEWKPVAALDGPTDTGGRARLR